jgi:antitoxin (DNA-binding transcriptional repressor) of toxin-antitoxin stability system
MTAPSGSSCIGIKASLQAHLVLEESQLSEESGIEVSSMSMATIHISEAEAAGDFAGLMARVRAGAEIVIESDARAVAVVRPAGDGFRPRLLSESIALAKRHAQELGYEPRMDPEFAADLKEIIDSRRPWNPPAWE